MHTQRGQLSWGTPSFGIRVAAILVGCLSLVSLVYFQRVWDPDQTSRVNSGYMLRSPNHQDESESVPLPGGERDGSDWAANYRPFPDLEVLVHTASRSQAVTVRSPGIEETVAGTIVFDWRTEAVGPVTLKIISNVGKEVRTFSNPTLPLRLSDLAQPGLYYWKIEDRNDLLFVGKFFLR